MSKTYWEKLKDPRWQRKRLEVLQSTEFTCEVCGDDSSTLHVHHKEYFKGREPWDYDRAQLAVLCDACHATIHESEDPLSYVSSYLPVDGPGSRTTAASLLSGMSDISIPAPYRYEIPAFWAGRIANNVLLQYHAGASAELQLVADISGTHADELWALILAFAESKRTI